VFNNDGTLWCEKPMPIQADFILWRLADKAQADPGLRDQQPWKAAYERNSACHQMTRRKLTATMTATTATSRDHRRAPATIHALVMSQDLVSYHT
jgi:hypothetical protein